MNKKTDLSDIALMLSLTNKEKPEIEKWLEMVYRLGFVDGALDSIKQLREVKK